MKRNKIFFCIIGVFAAFISQNCESAQRFEFICQNTMSVYILNNGNNYYFRIPVQYVGDYQIETFDFLNGYILIGDYKIPLERENVKINILMNKSSDEYGNTKGGFDTVYSQENGRIVISKLNEPVIKNKTDYAMNMYNINIERILNKNEINNIINEYKNLENIDYNYREGKTNSKMNIEYKITIDEEFEAGMFDYFEFKIKYHTDNKG